MFFGLQIAEMNVALSALGHDGYVCKIWYGIVWYGMVWYGMVWYVIVWVH